MFKKLLVASAVLAVSSSVALAAAAPYVGVGLGVNNLQTKVVSDSNASVKNLGARNALLNVFGGFGGLVNSNVYLGGELLFNAGNVQSKTTVANGGYTTFTAKNTYGVSFIPGVMLTDRTMLFARVGVVKTGFTAKAVAPNGLGSSSASKTLTGGQVGLGMQANIAQNMDVRGEYVYTSYKSFKTNGGISKLDPSSDQFNLALIYKFD